MMYIMDFLYSCECSSSTQSTTYRFKSHLRQLVKGCSCMMFYCLWSSTCIQDCTLYNRIHFYALARTTILCLRVDFTSSGHEAIATTGSERCVNLWCHTLIDVKSQLHAQSCLCTEAGGLRMGGGFRTHPIAYLLKHKKANANCTVL